MAHAKAPGIRPEEEDRAKLVREVIASRTFSKSTRLCELLSYICRVTLEGRAAELNEQQIGMQVFGRSASYSGSDDSIVRSQARLLRQKLEEYFEHECPHTDEVITVPKGGYVPVFRPRETAPRVEEFAAPPMTAPAVQAPAAVVAETPVMAPRGDSTWRRWLVLALVLVVAGGLLAWVLGRARLGHGAPGDLLWRSLFEKDQPTLIVASDDGLVLYQELTHTSVSLSDYLDGSYLHREIRSSSGTLTFDPAWFAAHQYTSIADLSLTLRLSRLPQAAAAQVEARDARGLSLEEMKTRNVILIGGPGSNPLVGLFADRLNFQLGWDWTAGEGLVRNTHPEGSEPAEYHDALLGSTRKSYGLLAYLPGIDDSRRALLVEGTGMAGTEAAADFLFGPDLDTFVRSIGATPERMPYFEVLLETTNIGGNAPQAHIVAYRRIRP